VTSEEYFEFCRELADEYEQEINGSAEPIDEPAEEINSGITRDHNNRYTYISNRNKRALTEAA